MNGLKKHLGYACLALLTLGSWWLANLSETEDSTSHPKSGHFPEFFSSGYRKWEMNQTGQVQNELVAEYIVRFNDDHTSHLERPTMIFRETQQAPWRISAETGEVSADSQTVLLDGRVEIFREPHGADRALTINTANLTVHPNAHVAETAAWAELFSLPNRTTGTGMKLAYKQPIRIELRAHVQGKYETKP